MRRRLSSQQILLEGFAPEPIKANEAREIELAIIHSFVNNDKWRLFYVYRGLIGKRAEREEKKCLWKARRRMEEAKKKAEKHFSLLFAFCHRNSSLRSEASRNDLNRRGKSREI
jgi:hypothetical protein